jgi:transposase
LVHALDATAWRTRGARRWLGGMAHPAGASCQSPLHRANAACAQRMADWRELLVSEGSLVAQGGPGGRQRCVAPLIRTAQGRAERGEAGLTRWGGRGAHGAAPAVAHGHGAADRGAVAGVGGPFPLAPHPPRDWPGESRTIGATCAARRRSARDVAGRPRRGSHASRGRTRPSLRGGMAPKKPGTGSEQGHRWGERVLSFRQICRLRGRPPCPMLLEAVVCLGTGEEPDLRWLAPRESLPVCSTPWPHTSGDQLHLQFSHYARRCVVTLGPNHSVALEINLSRKL